jgi:hypothetical protein
MMTLKILDSFTAGLKRASARRRRSYFFSVLPGCLGGPLLMIGISSGLT